MNLHLLLHMLLEFPNKTKMILNQQKEFRLRRLHQLFASEVQRVADQVRASG